MATLKQIGDIRIFAEVHQGAITTVYKGYQQALERTVLVKVLRPEFAHDEEIAGQFESEAKLVAKIQHPNVVTIFNFGNADGLRYFAAEFIEGLNLKELLTRAETERKENGLPIELALFILTEVVKGLQAAHREHILHRDIKPENIFMAHDGQVKLGDFGLSVRHSAGDDPAGSSGTPAYFSPEQILGKPLATASDIFSLGASFYEILTGLQPFRGASTSDIFHSILNDDPLKKKKKKRAIPEALRKICATMLAKDAQARYPDCAALLAALKEAQRHEDLQAGQEQLKSFISQPQHYHPPRPVEEAPKPEVTKSGTGRKRAVYFAGLVVLVLALVLFASLRPPREKSDRPANVLPGTTEVRLEPGPSANGHDAQIEPVTGMQQTGTAAMPREPVGDATAEPTAAQDAQLTVPEPADSGMTTAPAEVAWGSLQLVCTPWAAVFLDGDSVGLTPLAQPIQASPGAHQLQLRNPEFPDYATQIELRPDETANLEFSFWTTVARLNLEVSPWAKIFIDGEYRDTVPPQQQPFIVTAGQHKLRLEHPALGSWETDFQARAGETIQLKLNLRDLIKQ